MGELKHKRFRLPTAKPGELRVAYGKERFDRPDVFYCHGAHGADRSDARLLSHFFEEVKGLTGKTLRQELEERGYDITTIKFSVQQHSKPSAEGGKE